MARFYIIFCFLSCLHVSCNSTESGCIDPLAVNFNSSATDDDNSCIYDTIFTAPAGSVILSEQVKETSGLIFWDGFLWTMNDNSDTKLYYLDEISGEIAGEIRLSGVENRDWEDLSQDEDYMYVGDIGNNRGNRKDLHILRIHKLSLKSGDPSIDTIWFRFSDQQTFVPDGNNTEYDCEALVVLADSLYLFTKQWVSGYTTQYVLPKTPGTYVAQKRGTFNVRGQVTGATLSENGDVLVMCGYSGLIQPFLYIFYNYPGDDFFEGSRTRVNISIPFLQVEGVTSRNGLDYYITNEGSSANQLLKIPQQLHLIDLRDFLEE